MPTGINNIVRKWPKTKQEGLSKKKKKKKKERKPIIT
jgi:hypothetical protein